MRSSLPDAESKPESRNPSYPGHMKANLEEEIHKQADDNQQRAAQHEIAE